MIIELDAMIIQKLTKTELEIIRYINKHEEDLPNLSIVEIGFETYSSPSTVSRAIRKCGLDGFHELRHRSANRTKDDEIQNISDIMNKTLIEVQKILERTSLTKVLEIVRCLNEARQICVFVRGPTVYVGQEFSLKMQLLEYDVFCTDDPNIMKVKVDKMDKKDVLFIFSLNGETPELITSAETAYGRGNCVITCCCNEKSRLLPYSRHSLVGYKHSHQAIKEFEVSSRVALHMFSRIIIDHIATYG